MDRIARACDTRPHPRRVASLRRRRPQARVALRRRLRRAGGPTRHRHADARGRGRARPRPRSVAALQHRDQALAAGPRRDGGTGAFRAHADRRDPPAGDRRPRRDPVLRLAKPRRRRARGAGDRPRPSHQRAGRRRHGVQGQGQMLFRDVSLWTKMLDYLPFQRLATNILLADGVCTEKNLKRVILTEEIAELDLRRQYLVQNYDKEKQQPVTASTEHVETKRNLEIEVQCSSSKRYRTANCLDSPFASSDKEHKESEIGLRTPARRQPLRIAASGTYDGYYEESSQQNLLRSQLASETTGNTSKSISFQADRANPSIISAKSSHINQVTAAKPRPTIETLIEIIKPEPIVPNTTPLLEDSSDLPSYLTETKDIFFPLSYDPAYIQKNQLTNDAPDISPEDDRRINIGMLLNKLEQKILREAQLTNPKTRFVDRFYPSRSTNPTTQHRNVALTTISAVRDWIRRRDPDCWYKKRVKNIRMVDPATLEPRAERWLFEILEYQCQYRWEIYLRMFAFLVSPSKLKGPFWAAFRANITRGVCGEQQRRGKFLQAQADLLVKEGLLPANILFDPVFFHLYLKHVSFIPSGLCRQFVGWYRKSKTS